MISLRRLLESRVALWAPVVGYAVAIHLVSSLSELPPSPGPFIDKHWHALEYGGFTAVWARALAGGRLFKLTPMVALVSALSASCYGAIDEWHQSFVPGRDSSVWDLAADAIGAALTGAALVACGIIARFRRRPSPS